MPALTSTQANLMSVSDLEREFLKSYLTNLNPDGTTFSGAPSATFVAIRAGKTSTGASYLPTFNLQDYGLKCDGITDDSTAWNTACAAISAANGGRVTLPPGTTLLGNAKVYTNVHIAGSGKGTTILQAVATNTPILIPPTGTDADLLDIGGFSVKAHASGSTGPAIQVGGQTINQRWCWFHDIGYLSNGAGEFNSMFDLFARCYGCLLDRPSIENQGGPATVFKADNQTLGINYNPNFIFIRNPVVFNNTAITTVVDAGDSIGWVISDWHFEGNGNSCVDFVPGQGTVIEDGYDEANATVIIVPSVARSILPTNCVVDRNRWQRSGGSTLTLPATVTGWTIPASTNPGLTVTDNAGNLSANATLGADVALTTGRQNLLSLALGPGTWLISAVITVLGSSNASVDELEFWLGSVSASASGVYCATEVTTPLQTNVLTQAVLPPFVIRLAAAGTVYLNQDATAITGSPTAKKSTPTNTYTPATYMTAVRLAQ